MGTSREQEKREVVDSNRERGRREEGGREGATSIIIIHTNIGSHFTQWTGQVLNGMKKKILFSLAAPVSDDSPVRDTQRSPSLSFLSFCVAFRILR